MVDVLPQQDMHPITLRDYLEMKISYEQQLRLADDRRYTEVALEREKTLKIKEEADARALLLARDIQSYKDEKANELREQISSERGSYVTTPTLMAAVEKIEVLIAPLTAYVNAQQGRSSGVGASWTVLLGAVSLVSTIIVVFLAISGHLH